MNHIKNLFFGFLMYLKLAKNHEITMTKKSIVIKPIDKNVTIIDGGFRKKYFKPSKNIITEKIEL